jgi:hypothetical protein
MARATQRRTDRPARDPRRRGPRALDAQTQGVPSLAPRESATLEQRGPSYAAGPALGLRGPPGPDGGDEPLQPQPEPAPGVVANGPGAVTSAPDEPAPAPDSGLAAEPVTEGREGRPAPGLSRPVEPRSAAPSAPMPVEPAAPEARMATSAPAVQTGVGLDAGAATAGRAGGEPRARLGAREAGVRPVSDSAAGERSLLADRVPAPAREPSQAEPATARPEAAEPEAAETAASAPGTDASGATPGTDGALRQTGTPAPAQLQPEPQPEPPTSAPGTSEAASGVDEPSATAEGGLETAVADGADTAETVATPTSEAAAGAAAEHAPEQDAEEAAEAATAETASLETLEAGARAEEASGDDAAAPADTAAAAPAPPEQSESAGGTPGPAAAETPVAGGGAAPDAGVGGGGEVQGGTEADGEAELEARLAAADPERAVADEADPADVATGEPLTPEEADEALPSAPEIPPEPQAPAELAAESAASSPPAPDTADVPEPSASAGADVEPGAAVDQIPDAGATPADAEAQAEEAPAAAEPEPATADGFSGDEPALGGGALHHSPEVPTLSEAEKSAAFAVLAEGGGGGGAPAGGGGGGGGGAATEEPAPAPPDVSGAEPEAALAQVGSLPPAQLEASLGGVSAAIGSTVDAKQQELAANPPEMQRPTGSPKVLKGGAGVDAPAQPDAEKVEKTPEGESKPTPPPEPAPAAPPSPAEHLPEPTLAAPAGGELSDDDAERMQRSLRTLPTQHPGVQTAAGPAPKVPLQGDADPAKNTEQKQKLDQTVTSSLAKGREDAGKDLGEQDTLYPEVPDDETLTAKPAAAAEGGGAGAGGGGGAGAGGGGVAGAEPGAAAAAAGAGAAGGGGDAEAASIIANEEKGAEIRAAVTQGQADLATKRQEHAEQAAQERAKSREAIDAEVSRSAAEQAAERTKAQGDIGAKRGEWTREQDKVVGDATKKADKTYQDGQQEITDKHTKAEADAEQHLTKGEADARREQQQGEQKAEQERQRGERESGGLFGWVASRAKSFFRGIVAGVKRALDAMASAVRGIIDAARKLAREAIERARSAITAIGRRLRDGLLAIGDALGVDLKALYERFTKWIKEKIAAVKAFLTRLANQLKAWVQNALNALAEALAAAWNALKSVWNAVVDAVKAAVKATLDWAKSALEAFGAFAALVKDVAGDPIGWLGKLGAAVADGIRNHLWAAFKNAVKEWFNAKIEQIFGLGRMVWGLIQSGGLALAEVGRMAWEGIKSLIPPTLIRILVEKLMAMIVPAAGAVMMVIEGLQAAWGSVSQIITAFAQFFAFLKAVKGGGAGPKFALALAAAAVAVIDFVANWLIAKLARGAAKIGGKIKALAKKILGRKKGRAAGRRAQARSGERERSSGRRRGSPGAHRRSTSRSRTRHRGPPRTGRRASPSERRKKREERADARRRLAKAKRELRARFRAAVPLREARGIVAGIAARNRVRQTFRKAGKRWSLTMTVNPRFNSYFRTAGEREEVEEALRKADRTQAALLQKLDTLWRQELENAPQELGPRQREQHAHAQLKADMEREGGAGGWVAKHGAELEPPASGGVHSGNALEAALAAKLLSLQAEGKVVVSQRELPGKGGIDITVVDPATGVVETYEVKAGDFKAMNRMASDRDVPAGRSTVPLDPEPGTDAESTRHLRKHPEDAERIEKGDVLADAETGDVFENKLSAITENLLSNLARVESYLQAAARKEKDRNRRKQIRQAVKAIKAIIRTNEGGKLRRIIAVKGSASSAQVEAASRILGATAKRLDQVEIENILRAVSAEGEMLDQPQII